MTVSRLATYVVLLFSCCSFIGCNSATNTTPPATDEHSHDSHSHHLESLAEGIEQLKTYQGQMKAAFDAGTPRECDDALHEAVHVLEAIPSAHDVAEMATEDQEMIKANCRDLFGLLDQIHHGFHTEGDVDATLYDSIADDFDKALANLARKIPAEGHDHDEDMEAVDDGDDTTE